MKFRTNLTKKLVPLFLFLFLISIINSLIITNAELNNIPDWVKPNIYAKYRSESSISEDTIFSTYTVISVNSSDLIFEVKREQSSETDERRRSYPEASIFITQNQIQMTKKGSTSLNFLPSNMSASYVKEESITVPSGTFQCLKITLTYDDGYVDLWVEKNTGLFVKDIGEHESGETSSLELLETNVPLSQQRGIPGFPIESLIHGIILVSLLMWMKSEQAQSHF